MKNISKIAKDANDLARKLSAFIELSEVVKDMGDIEHHARECETRRQKELSAVKVLEDKRVIAEESLKRVVLEAEATKNNAQEQAKSIVDEANRVAAEKIESIQGRLSAAKVESRELEGQAKGLKKEISQRKTELEELKSLIEKTKSAIARI